MAEACGRPYDRTERAPARAAHFQGGPPVARYETKIKDGAQEFLEGGEEVLAAAMARPRGWTQATASPGGGAIAGAIGGAIGGKKQREQVGAAEDVGFEL